jgi:hypothetical protein
LSPRNSLDRVSLNKKNHVVLRLCLRTRSWTKLRRTTDQLTMPSRALNTRSFAILRDPDHAAYSAAVWAFHVFA